MLYTVFFNQIRFSVDSLDPGHCPRTSILEFLKIGQVLFSPCTLHIYIYIYIYIYILVMSRITTRVDSSQSKSSRVKNFETRVKLELTRVDSSQLWLDWLDIFRVKVESNWLDWLDIFRVKVESNWLEFLTRVNWFNLASLISDDLDYLAHILNSSSNEWYVSIAYSIILY